MTTNNLSILGLLCKTTPTQRYSLSASPEANWENINTFFFLMVGVTLPLFNVVSDAGAVKPKRC